MLRVLLILTLTATALHAQLSTKPTVDFNSKIKPIFAKHCYDCHSEVKKKDKGGFAFDKLDRLAKNIGRGLIIVPGSIEDSDIIDIVQGSNGKKKMPPEGKGELSSKEIELMRTWIKEGANVPGLDMSKIAGGTSKKSVPEVCNWTNMEGKTLRATFQGLDNGLVLLKAENGTVYKYPLKNLNAAGQSQAKIQAFKFGP
jgi:hypothetical protein